jgi:hypothetical protein
MGVLVAVPAGVGVFVAVDVGALVAVLVGVGVGPGVGVPVGVGVGPGVNVLLGVGVGPGGASVGVGTGAVGAGGVGVSVGWHPAIKARTSNERPICTRVVSLCRSIGFSPVSETKSNIGSYRFSIHGITTRDGVGLVRRHAP